MNIQDKYFIRPASFGTYAVYRMIGQNRAETYHTGTRKECEEALDRFKSFIMKIRAYINNTGCLDKGKAEYLVECQAPEPPSEDLGSYYASHLDMDIDVENFIELIVSDMIEAGFSPFKQEMQINYIVYLHGLKEDPHGRYDFIPEVGSRYRNDKEGGTWYKCLANGDNFSILRSDSTGWTFKAFGIVIDEAGIIGWDFSTEGRFEKINSVSMLQKKLIYDELKMEYAKEDCLEQIRAELEWREERQKEYLRSNDAEKSLLFRYYDYEKEVKVLNILKNITDDDVFMMADRFIEDHAMDVADNDQWIGILTDFVSERSKDLEKKLTALTNGLEPLLGNDLSKKLSGYFKNDISEFVEFVERVDEGSGGYDDFGKERAFNTLTASIGISDEDARKVVEWAADIMADKGKHENFLNTFGKSGKGGIAV